MDMEGNEGQISTINQLILTFEDYIKELIETYGTNLDENNHIILSDDVKDSFTQKKEDFLIDILKLLCLSILCGEHIEIKDLFEKLEKLEERIQELPNKTNDFSPDIQSQIFELSSAIIIVLEFYKDFFKQIENYYSEDRIDFLFQRNTQIQKELNKQILQPEIIKKINYFSNLISVTSTDHFSSTKDGYIFEVFKAEDFFNNFKTPAFRDLTAVITEKIKFLKFKWRERRLQENPLVHSYLENGIHKKIEDYNNITNDELNQWKEIIQTQYELKTEWKSILSDRVKSYKGSNINSISEILEIHQLVKYFKDVKPNSKKLKEISDKLLKDKDKNQHPNFYNKYAGTIFCNYALNNEFSLFIENESSIDRIESKYDEINSKINDTANNYFLKFKYLNKIFDILLPKINSIEKELFINDYGNVLDKSKTILEEYRENINWSLANFNYIFILPFEESKAKFKIDGNDYDIFFASSFALPPSSKRIEDDYNSVKEKFDKLYSYLDFSKFFSEEMREIKTIKQELSSKEIKSIELLSLFTAVISFIIGGISGFAFIKDLYTALLFFVVFTTSLLTFLIALFVFTRGKQIVENNKWYIIGVYGVFIIAILLLFGSNLIKSTFLIEKSEIKKLEERFKNDSLNNLNKAQIIPPYPSTIYIQSKVDSINSKTTPLPQGGQTQLKNQ